MIDSCCTVIYSRSKLDICVHREIFSSDYYLLYEVRRSLTKKKRNCDEYQNLRSIGKKLDKKFRCLSFFYWTKFVCRWSQLWEPNRKKKDRKDCLPKKEDFLSWQRRVFHASFLYTPFSCSFFCAVFSLQSRWKERECLFAVAGKKGSCIFSALMTLWFWSSMHQQDRQREGERAHRMGFNVSYWLRKEVSRERERVFLMSSLSSSSSSYNPRQSNVTRVFTKSFKCKDDSPSWSWLMSLFLIQLYSLLSFLLRCQSKLWFNRLFIILFTSESPKDKRSRDEWILPVTCSLLL